MTNRQFKTTRDAAADPAVREKLLKELDIDGRIPRHEREDAAQDILWVWCAKPKPIRGSWKALAGVAVRNYANMRHRDKHDDDLLVFNNPDPDLYVPSETHSKRQNAPAVGFFFSADEDDGPPSGASISERLNRVFRILMIDVFRVKTVRLQDEGPKVESKYRGAREQQPGIKVAHDTARQQWDDGVVDFVRGYWAGKPFNISPEQFEKRHIAWCLYNGEYPPPSDNEIAKRMTAEGHQLSRQSVTKAIDEWYEAQHHFYAEMAQQYKALSDEEKLSKIARLLDAYLKADIEQARLEARFGTESRTDNGAARRGF